MNTPNWQVVKLRGFFPKHYKEFLTLAISSRVYSISKMITSAWEKKNSDMPMICDIGTYTLAEIT